MVHVFVAALAGTVYVQLFIDESAASPVAVIGVFTAVA
jgi:hypothetical protein